MESNPDRKASCWNSLLSVLLDAGAEQMDIWLVEVAPGGEWDFAFWQYEPDGAMCTYRCAANKSIWEPIETPAYTGKAHAYEQPDGRHGEKPWHGDPDPK